MIDFTNIRYMELGSPMQQAAYSCLRDCGLMEQLREYQPVVAGTIPIGIDIESSDIDVLCCVADENRAELAAKLKLSYSSYPCFCISGAGKSGSDPLVCSFTAGGFEVEIYACVIPTLKQNGYLHMVVEYEILSGEDEEFRGRIIELKRGGLKTEPAFAEALGLAGDPYQALLEYGRINGYL